MCDWFLSLSTIIWAIKNRGVYTNYHGNMNARTMTTRF